jgi:two-component system CheB/CheR fusion protein
MPPQFALSLGPQDLLRLSFFTLVSLLISSIAKQKTALEKLAEQQRAKLSTIVESSADAIFSKTLDGTITTWNRSAEMLYGYSAEEIIGKNVSLLAAAGKKDEISQILQTLRRGGRIEHYETERIAKDGKLIHISLSVSPLFDREGTIIGAATIARDITARKLADAALQRTEKLAAAGRLSASIAHEINNPLEAVTNLLYLLQRNPSLDERARRHLAMADQEVRRVSHLARQTLGFYRDTSSPASVDVAATLDEVLGLYLQKLNARRIRIEKDYAEHTEIQAFPGEVRQIFSNLIANALDAMDTNGRLALRVSKSHSWLGDPRPGMRITVCDSGCGIDPASKSRIFEPFYTTKKDVGTGLGLWLTKEIVQKHAGTISLRSSVRPGRSGTVFSIFLPSEPASREQKRSTDPTETQSAEGLRGRRSA